MAGYSQSVLANVKKVNIDTNVDIVFLIDATSSMEPLIEKVKQMAIDFEGDLIKKLDEKNRKISELRIKVIVFRDYYVDDVYAMQESPFFDIHDDNERSEFQDFVNRIEVGGGGDEPESGLEALDVAIRQPFVNYGTKKRHIIVLFTDATAHPLEQQEDGVPDCYPQVMCKTLEELYMLWNGMEKNQSSLAKNTYVEKLSLDPEAKRLVLFAPNDYPWNSIDKGWGNVVLQPLIKGNRAEDLDMNTVFELLANSFANTQTSLAKK